MENLSAALNAATAFTSDAVTRTDWLKTLAGEIKRGVSFEDITKAVNSVGKGVRSHGKNRLRKALLEAGRKFGPDEHAHHIVPTTFGKEVGDQCRAILEKHGIKLDEAVNGVALPGPLHSRIHTKEYARRLLRRLQRVDHLGRSAVEDVLQKIGNDLRNGILP